MVTSSLCLLVALADTLSIFLVSAKSNERYVDSEENANSATPRFLSLVRSVFVRSSVRSFTVTDAQGSG